MHRWKTLPASPSSIPAQQYNSIHLCSDPACYSIAPKATDLCRNRPEDIEKSTIHFFANPFAVAGTSLGRLPTHFAHLDHRTFFLQALKGRLA